MKNLRKISRVRRLKPIWLGAITNFGAIAPPPLSSYPIYSHLFGKRKYTDEDFVFMFPETGMPRRRVKNLSNAQESRRGFPRSYRNVQGRIDPIWRSANMLSRNVTVTMRLSCEQSNRSLQVSSAKLILKLVQVHFRTNLFLVQSQTKLKIYSHTQSLEFSVDIYSLISFTE